MKPEGPKLIFSRSVEKDKLWYTDFYGDGNRKVTLVLKTYTKSTETGMYWACSEDSW